jgi:hypothetical protein
MPDEPDSHPSSRVPHDIPSWRDHAALVEEREERRERLEVNVPKPGSATAKLASFRDRVQVPDYHLIRRIGSGAYGEVWLAQSITGALRAVKIVWREDFEFEKTFHREFEGIQQFEPISRGHPGLVQVLHVGWNEEHGFYYYVMELADDAVEGPHITDLSTYAPRTLSRDQHDSNKDWCCKSSWFGTACSGGSFRWFCNACSSYKRFRSGFNFCR